MANSKARSSHHALSSYLYAHFFLISTLGTVHKDVWNHTCVPWNEARGTEVCIHIASMYLCEGTCDMTLMWKLEDNMKA